MTKKTIDFSLPGCVVRLDAFNSYTIDYACAFFRLWLEDNKEETALTITRAKDA